MKTAVLVAVTVFAALVAAPPAVGAATCGLPPLKPVPPVGCRDLTPQCVCTADGECRWEWVCVPDEVPDTGG